MSRDGIQVTEDEYQTKHCAFCQDEIEPGQQGVICRKCGTAHHKSCWQENRGCSVLNCNGRAFRNYSVPPPAHDPAVQIIDEEPLPIEILPDPIELTVVAGAGSGGSEDEIHLVEGTVQVQEEIITIDDVDLNQVPDLVLCDEDLAPAPAPTPEVNCTYCQTKIEMGQPAVMCAVCEAPYHQECWRSLGSCANLGCKSRRDKPFDPDQQAAPATTTITAGEQVSATLFDKVKDWWRSMQD